VNRTRLGDLLVPFLVIGIAAYLLLRFSYEDIPAIAPFTPVPLTVLAIIEFILSRRVRAVIGHDPDVKALTAIAITRLVALGKASALVGAGVSGAALALVIHVLPDVSRVDAARSDAIVGGLLVLAGALVTGAGLLLERSGIAPPSGDRTAASQ
jgi:hypothetical protein